MPKCGKSRSKQQLTYNCICRTAPAGCSAKGAGSGGRGQQPDLYYVEIPVPPHGTLTLLMDGWVESALRLGMCAAAALAIGSLFFGPAAPLPAVP